ncbi:MAG: hypothetical protein AAF517_15655, partial [Planctomycetota bacterium]
SDPNLVRGVRDLYVGHTHRPFEVFQVGGVRIHNTGSTIVGMSFRPLVIADPLESSVQAKDRPA